MKPTEAQTLVANLLTDADKANQLAKTAAGARKSLRGDGPYAIRFHTAVISISTAEGKLRPVLSGLELADEQNDEFTRSLSVLKSEDPAPAARAESLKRLQLLCQSVILPKLQAMTVSAVPATEQVLPMAIVNETRPYIEKVVLQANGSYEHGWYDACSVMIRRLVETLIIEVYIAKSKADEIKGMDGHFFMLAALVDSVLAEKSFHLGRETSAGLPLIKSLGDRAAHNRFFIAKKADLDKPIHSLRVIAEELLHLAGLK